MALLVLFSSSFLAATILPFYSELVLGALLVGGHDPWALWVVASLGNTLGAVVNWALARFLLRFRDRSWFPVSEKGLEKGQRWFDRYGVWSLLFAWLPIGGDALTFVAGMMKTRLWLFVVLVGIGKAARYAVLIAMLLPVLPD